MEERRALGVEREGGVGLGELAGKLSETNMELLLQAAGLEVSVT